MCCTVIMKAAVIFWVKATRRLSMNQCFIIISNDFKKLIFV